MHSEAIFLQNTRAIRSILNLNYMDYAASFGMNSRDAEKHLLNHQEFPLQFAMNFCEFFHLDLELLFSDRFDVKAFARSYLRAEPVLPDHYQKETNSQVITLINFVNGMNDAGLEWLNDLIFSRMQIPKTILLYPEISIPFKLIVDYLELVEKFKTNLNIMRHCGHEGIANLNRKFGFTDESTSLTKNYYDEFFTEKIKVFDKSYEYKFLSLKGDELILQCRLKEEVQDLFQTKSMSNLALLNYKCGIASGIATLFNQPSTEIDILNTGSKDGIDLLLMKMPTQPSLSKQYLH